ncbi:ATP-binding protein [Vibrio mediterranei]|uniref:ATP-binding protein n=1 Tax=Vibrio mediterranei TaxID=689 RepID=UPI001EFDAB83|nr:ATP-binding protein [Vibrio mediterranei]MCG9628907.1 ATP-binding protein [Vibrio mediterranei]
MATARSFGNYDLAAALADLIDNSIKAQSKYIDIEFIPKGKDVIVTIRDDGHGMTREELIAAMRPASSHPDDKRNEDDLGRFGWGMKSASLSQARVLTVISWTAETICAAEWNIDDIDNWEMAFFEGVEAKALLEKEMKTPSGTEVRWSRTDRLMHDVHTETIDDALTTLIFQARESLALTFHRYLSGSKSKRFQIRINGSELPLIDPFLQAHPATQSMPKEVISMANNGRVTIQPYVLPHFSKLTTEEQRTLGGAEGMVKNQGFYVYRNQRLIIHGTWFKLIPHRDISQLTRIMIDLPNSVDHDWRITLDKSGAQLPSELKGYLKGLVKKFNRRSHAVHRRKGVSVNPLGRTPVWNREIKNGQVKYLINREHPILKGIEEQIQDSSKNVDMDVIFTLLESYFPTDTFLNDAKVGELNQTITSDEQFEKLIAASVVSYIQKNSGPHKLDEFLRDIKFIEPFASHWVFVEEYVRTNMTSILE